MKRGREKHQEDRLSALPDRALQLVLSHLATDEALRTSALSRRWRRVHEAVPVVDLTDPAKGKHECWHSKKHLPVCFDQMVTGAILRRPPGTHIRTLRLDAFHPPHDLLDQWIVSAVTSGAEDIDIKLRYHCSGRRLCPFSLEYKASADFEDHQRNSYVKTQPHLFRCGTLRRLRLTSWTLDLPQGMVVSSLDTLCLARIMDPKGMLQQLLSSCPRLADLTLQEIPSISEVSVKSAHLRRFAMICCHHASRVKLHSSHLQSLHYKGGIPLESLFEVANYKGIVALTIEICEDLSVRTSTEVAPITGLISQCTELAYLHLSLSPSMAYHSSLFADAIWGLPLRQLSLKGCLREGHAIRSVAVLLRETNNLEVLSLFPLGQPQKKMYSCMSDDESDTETKDDSDDGGDRRSRVTDSLWQMYIRCLGHKLRRINIVNYKGLPLERILANFLLDRGKTLEEFSVTSQVGNSKKHHMARLLRSWRCNRHTRVTVN